MPETWAPGVAGRGVLAARDDSSARAGDRHRVESNYTYCTTGLKFLRPSPIAVLYRARSARHTRSASRVSQQTIGRLVAAHTSKKRGPGRRGRRGSLSRWQDGREPPSERASAAPRCRRQPFGPNGPHDASRSPRGGAAPVSAAHSDPTSPRRPAPEVRRCRRPGRTAAAQAHAKGPQTHTTRQKNAPEPPTTKYSRTNKFGPPPRITPQSPPPRR